jgi:hypothetical protein
MCVRPFNVKDKHSCVYTLLVLNRERSKVKALDWRIQKVIVNVECTQAARKHNSTK